MSFHHPFNNRVVFPFKEKIYVVLEKEEGPFFRYLVSESKEGKTFKESRELTLHTKRRVKVSLRAEHIRVSQVEKGVYATWAEPTKGLVIARIKSPSHWEVEKEITEIRGEALLCSDRRKNKDGYLIFSVQGKGTLAVGSISKNRMAFRELGLVTRLLRREDYGPVHLLSVEEVEEGILVLYSVQNGWGFPVVRGVLVNFDDPTEVLWRTEEALWEAPLSVPPTPPHIISIFTDKKKRVLYVEQSYGTVERIILPQVHARIFPLAKKGDRTRKSLAKVAASTLVRFPGNPLIEPSPENYWEAFAAFNPAALHIDGTVHLLYRAQGYDGVSVLGYAASHNGVDIAKRENEPVYVPTSQFEVRTNKAKRSPFQYVSGGGLGGCEDPRLVLIEDTVYLIYVAFDGSRPPGVALSSISKEDFLRHQWNWTEPRLISRPGVIQKNWVLFPEKINGQFVILHGINPTVQVEYLDTLDDLGKTHYIESLASHGGRGYVASERKHAWDNIVRGAGAPPVKTEHGWLVFYHAMDQRDPGKYKVGAMLLDLEHPETVLYRAARPILEPEAVYENNGHKRGVVYVCGAVVKDDILFVYYGASDKTAAVAAAPLEQFLQDLMTTREPVLLRQSPIKNKS